MKKLTRIVSLMLAFALIFGAHAASQKNVAHAIEISFENTYALCNDTIDNDMDLTTDLSDTDCIAFVPVPEVTAELCSDSVDNDFDLTTDLSDTDCAAFVPVATTTPAVENTAELCTDGLDNDMDLTTDLSDTDCASFAPVATSTPAVENTAELCTDGLDNDMDLTTDLSDTDCAAFAPVATITPTSTPPAAPTNPGSTETGGQQTGGGGFSSFVSTGGSTGGTVLGASTDDSTGAACSAVLVEYMKKGKKNSTSEVKKLQSALNQILGTKLPVTGYFGSQTDAAVRQLQSKYSAQILAPWVNLKLMDSATPTGYVYKTTQWFINTQICAGLKVPAPILP